MAKFTFIGKPSGNGECFAFEVSEETYKAVCGEERWKEEIQYRKEMKVDNFDIDERWLIYPDSLFHGKKKINVEITISEII